MGQYYLNDLLSLGFNLFFFGKGHCLSKRTINVKAALGGGTAHNVLRKSVSWSASLKGNK